jgi:putative ABC transport system substrate-binding protein
LLAVIVLAFATAMLPRLAQAQSSRSVPRVAYVWIFSERPSAPQADAFRDRLRELGWVDGKTVSLELHDAQGSPEKLDAIMRGLADSKVDVIVTACTPEATAAVKATKTIPIVMAATGDPVAAGLVTSLAKPGGNITGVSGIVAGAQRQAPRVAQGSVP